MISTHHLFERQSEEIKRISSTTESIKKFFPSLYNEVSGNIQLFFPLMTKRDINISDLYNQKSENLEGNVFINNSNQPNAYTLPALQTRLGAQTTVILPLTFIYALYGFTKLSNNPLNGRPINNKKVYFQNKGNIKMLSWETKGFQDIIPEPDIRYSVYLHEIGHWVKYEPVFTSMILKLLRITFLIPLVPLLLIIEIALARSAEWKADKFAADMGYKKELSEALNRIGYTVRTNTNLYVKFQDYIKYILVKFHNIIDTVLPLSTHPSIRKRTNSLNESILYEGIITDKLITLFEPVDKLISQNIHQLFPLTR